jgi:hypothetical protein
MERTITLTLDGDDAEILVNSLAHRKQRLCDMRRELCGPDPEDELEREELAYCERENEVVERVLTRLRAILEAAPAN